MLKVQTPCRICECQVDVVVLKEHSLKCKQFYYLQEGFDACKVELIKRINYAQHLLNKIVKNLGLLINDKRTLSPEKKKQELTQLSKCCKALKYIITYGEKISRNQSHFDSESNNHGIEYSLMQSFLYIYLVQMQLRGDLETIYEEIEDEKVSALISKIIKLLEVIKYFYLG